MGVSLRSPFFCYVNNIFRNLPVATLRSNRLGYRYTARRLVFSAALLVVVAPLAYADFSNADAWDNGGDLRQIRRTLSGWPASGSPVYEVPIPPVAEDGASSLHGEARAQTLLLKQIALLLCMIFGAQLLHTAVARVRA